MGQVLKVGNRPCHYDDEDDDDDDGNNINIMCAQNGRSIQMCSSLGTVGKQMVRLGLTTTDSMVYLCVVSISRPHISTLCRYDISIVAT